MERNSNPRRDGNKNVHMNQRSIPRTQTPPSRRPPKRTPAQRKKTPPSIPRQISPQRQAQIKRRKKRKTKIVFLFVCLLAAVVFIILSLTVLFRIEAFTVKGESRYSQEEIISNTGIGTGENLFLSKRADAQRNLLKKLPYLETADVSIKLPDEIVITVTAAVPSYLLSWEGKTLLLSDKGKILDIDPASQPEGLPLISGLNIVSAEPGCTIEYENENAIAVMEELTAAITAYQMTGIKEIKFSSGLSVILNYQDRIQIDLGVSTRLDEKIQMAAYVVSNKLSADDTGTLTLSSDATRASFKPDYDTPNIVIPPGGSVSSEPEKETSSSAA